MTPRKIYIGDSVYATFDGYGIMLTTENGLPNDPSNSIYLGAASARSLVRVYGSDLQKGGNMKTYRVTAEFPQVLAKDAIQSTVTKAGRFGHAIKKGLGVLQARPGIKGKRITIIKVVAVVVPEVKQGQV